MGFRLSRDAAEYTMSTVAAIYPWNICQENSIKALPQAKASR